jgi:hypothetical protein
MKRIFGFIALMAIIGAAIYFSPRPKKATPSTVAPVNQNASPSHTNHSSDVDFIAAGGAATHAPAINSLPKPAPAETPTPQACELAVN